MLDDTAHGSLNSHLTKGSLESLNRELYARKGADAQSYMSFDQTASISEDCSSVWSASFCYDEAGKEFLSPLGVTVEKFAKKLHEEPPPSERQCTAALQSLWNILRALTPNENSACSDASSCSSDEHKTSAKQLAVSSGAIPGLTTCMKLYKDNIRIQSRAVLLLGEIARDNASYQNMVADHHGVSYVLAALLHPQHSKQPTMCLEACASLAHMTSLCHRNVYQFAHGEGVRTLKKVMEENQKQVKVQISALQVLRCVAKQPQPKSRIKQAEEFNQFEFLDRIEEPELIELIIETILRHKKDKAILQVGGNLIFILATQGKPRTQASLVWSKAVPLLFKVMKNLLCNSETQLECILALHELSRERPEARQMVSEEGCSYLLDALQAHPKNAQLQLLTCQFLKFLGDHQTYYNISKTLKKNSKYKKVLQATIKEHKACADIAGQILAGSSS